MAYAGLAAIGGAALSGVVARVEEPLRIASVAVLVVIALAGFRRARSGDTGIELGNGERAAVFGTYLRFLALTLINPATLVYFAAVIIGLGVAIDMTRAEGLAFVLGAGLASLSWQLALAGVGAVARVRLTERALTVVTILGNLLILGFAVVIAFR